MKLFLSMLAVAFALAATQAAAQGVDLTGQYRCVQMCKAEGQPAFITQSGWEMNLRNEAGEPSRGWFDRVGRIWVQSWNEGATVSEDGTFIWFDRGTVWQRDLGEPDAGPIDRSRRGQRSSRRGAVESPVESPVVAGSPYDGNWAVAISTQSGPCDSEYRFGVQIINGNVVGPSNTRGRVAPNGSIWVSVSAGSQQADGQGSMSRNVGAGTWRGQGSGAACVGTWEAVRRG
jgi:hypothetical protein